MNSYFTDHVQHDKKAAIKKSNEKKKVAEPEPIKTRSSVSKSNVKKVSQVDNKEAPKVNN